MSNYFNNEIYYDYLVQYFDIQKSVNSESDNKRPDLKLINYYLKKLMIQSNDKVLEVGCGLGRILDHLICEYNVLPYGIDVSKLAIEHAKKNLNNISENIHCGSIENMDFFKNNYFEKIICWGVFDLTNQKDALDEIIDKLNVGGTLLITGKNYLYHEDDIDALIAEEKCREKGIPNSYTVFPELIKYLDERSCKIKESYFFERRGDFSVNKYSTEVPDKFLEYCLIILKGNSTTRKLNNIYLSKKYSNTFEKVSKYEKK